MIETGQNTFPPEFRLILAGSQWPLSIESQQQVRALSSAVDWERCLRLISSNRVAPLLYRALNAANVDLPPAVAAALRAEVARKTQLAMRQTSELIRLTRRFGGAGIGYLVFKGIPLSIQAFGTPVLREGGDIDILISPGAVMDAERILLDEGYRRSYPGSPLTARRLSFLIKTVKGFDYVDYSKGQAVDLHWRFFRDRFFASPEQIVRSPGQQVLIGEQPVMALQTDDLLLYLCVHGWTSCWIEVRWLADVGALLNGLNSANLTALANRASAIGIGPAWQAMLMILKRLCLWRGTCPREVDDQGAVQRFLRVYDLCLNDYLAHGRKEPRTRYRIGRALLLRASWRARLELLRVDLFHADDSELIELPDSLLAFDFLLHPAYWLMRKAGVFGFQQQAPRRPF